MWHVISRAARAVGRVVAGGRRGVALRGGRQRGCLRFGAPRSCHECGAASSSAVDERTPRRARADGDGRQAPEHARGGRRERTNERTNATTRPTTTHWPLDVVTPLIESSSTVSFRERSHSKVATWPVSPSQSSVSVPSSWNSTTTCRDDVVVRKDWGPAAGTTTARKEPPSRVGAEPPLEGGEEPNGPVEVTCRVRMPPTPRLNRYE